MEDGAGAEADGAEADGAGAEAEGESAAEDGAEVVAPASFVTKNEEPEGV
ncbi:MULTISPECIES: hypothetical protein [Microbacterium]|nr:MULTISPECIES: hypothetical protein [Microbacterium]UWF77869.1 hypothetical protein JSY13_02040 [Microbacterium neungamense]WCM56045.1 hypothetical protein JRG78_02080 [Microbacterium sp. EF45047]